jgi:DNA-binding phage protein
MIAATKMILDDEVLVELAEQEKLDKSALSRALTHSANPTALSTIRFRIDYFRENNSKISPTIR